MSKIGLYNRVLIADDCELEIKEIKKLFEVNNIEVVYVQSPDKAFDEIEKGKFDLLILDWFFAQPSNQYAIEMIHALIANKYYIPVFVYSNKIANEELEDLPKEYPTILLNSMSKPSLGNAESVKKRIDTWFESNPNVRLANKWYSSVQESIGNTLLEIYNRTGGGVIDLLGETYGNENDKGAKDILNLIMTVFQEKMLQKSSVLDEMDAMLLEIGAKHNHDESSYENYELLRSFEMYSKIDKEISIATGDLLRINLDDTDKENLFSGTELSKESSIYAVVISGECDYANSSKKLRFHKFVVGTDLLTVCDNQGKNVIGKIRDFLKELSNHNLESYYYLPFIQCESDNKYEFKNVVLDFQNIVTVAKENVDDYIKSKRICRLRPIYYQHLLRRYSAYSSRIGVPCIPVKKIGEIAERIHMENMNKASNVEGMIASNKR